MYPCNGAIPNNSKDEIVATKDSTNESQKSSTRGSHVIYSSAPKPTSAYGHISVKLNITIVKKGG